MNSFSRATAGIGFLALAACSGGDKTPVKVPERAGITAEQVGMCLNDERKKFLDLQGISPELQHAYDLCAEFVQANPQIAELVFKFAISTKDEDEFNEQLNLPDDNPVWEKFEALAEAVEDAPDRERLLVGVQDVEALARLAVRAKEGSESLNIFLMAYFIAIFLFIV